MKLNVYEYTIKDSISHKTYKGSYSVIADSPKEQELKLEFKSKLVDTINHTKRSLYQPKKEFKIYKLSDNTVI